MLFSNEVSKIKYHYNWMNSGSNTIGGRIIIQLFEKAQYFLYFSSMKNEIRNKVRCTIFRNTTIEIFLSYSIINIYLKKIFVSHIEGAIIFIENTQCFSSHLALHQKILLFMKNALPPTARKKFCPITFF